jgi:hypothetical protein
MAKMQNVIAPIHKIEQCLFRKLTKTLNFT